MRHLAEKCIRLQGIRRVISGFQRIKVSCAWRDVWLSGSPGHTSDTAKMLRFSSPVVSKAACGSDSGSTEACRTSRIVASSRRIQPLMGWAMGQYKIFNSIEMEHSGLQPGLALAG